jgi:hypothetical protein
MSLLHELPLAAAGRAAFVEAVAASITSPGK